MTAEGAMSGPGPLAARLDIVSHRRDAGMSALLVAFVLGQVGESVVLIGLPWFVLETTGDVARMGIVAAASALGTAVFGLLGGPVVDHIGFKRMVVVSYCVGGAAMAAVPLLHSLERLPFGLLIGLTLASTALDGPGRSALSGLIAGLARANRMSLESTNSLFQGVGHVVFLVSPALGGLLATATGAAVLLAVDAAGCLLAGLIVASLVHLRRPQWPGPAATGAASRDGLAPAGVANDGSGGGFAARLRAGFRVLKADRVVRFLVLFGATVSAVDLAVVSVVLVAYSHAVLGSAAGFGAMVTAYSVGAMTGALLYGVAGASLPRRPVFLAGYALAGMLFALLIAAPGITAVLGAVALVGVAVTPIETIGTAVLQERVPMHVYGRVLGVRATVVAVCGPVAIAGMAALLATAGIRPTLFVVVGLYATALGVGIASPALRRIEAKSGVKKTSTPSHR